VHTKNIAARAECAYGCARRTTWSGIALFGCFAPKVTRRLQRRRDGTPLQGVNLLGCQGPEWPRILVPEVGVHGSCLHLCLGSVGTWVSLLIGFSVGVC
jgi:hypothetical protein